MPLFFAQKVGSHRAFKVYDLCYQLISRLFGKSGLQL